ncbi:lytic polysaccharide monooxygenase [Streptomyces sp. NPDC052012]|uniref:lytic polysaccharide monooxygenase n=1 Tax=Streptomyces sp. NPDC052012 TaxID=3155051 RepID=UPI00344DFFF1
MPRTTAHRVTLAAALVAPLLLPLTTAAPARAHGAPTDPVSRVVACSPEGGERAGSAACRAAVAANGAPFTAWDNLRVPDVGGADRQRIPDGRLCSGGLPAYRGLDLARADWPATRVRPGGTLSMTYVSTIPHTGTFRMYLTKPGYAPAGPLTWSDLPRQPFAEVTDPPLEKGAYRLRVTLPSDRRGRHVLYTIWQNSSTPDTYYSCSDVVFPEPGKQVESEPAKEARQQPGEEPTETVGTAGKERDREGKPVGARPDGGAAQPGPAPKAAAPAAAAGPSAPLLAGGAAAVLLLTAGALLVLRLRRR